MTNVESLVQEIAQAAKKASYKLSGVPSEKKDQALMAIAKSLDENRSLIKAENAKDVKLAKENGLAESLIDRLVLNDQRIDDMIKGAKEIAELSDPVGKLITSKTLENKILLEKIRVPIGVIGIIFESRPNVVLDVAALCIKSGNAVILRGGKESAASNHAIMKAIEEGLNKASFIKDAVQIIPIQDRSAVNALCRLNSLVDVIIPRGGENLIKAVSECATVPVIKHYKGVCHVFVDESADQEAALQICQNAKCQRPSVCNAIETLLVHKNCAKEFLPKVVSMFEKEGVEIRGDIHAKEICPQIKPASESDWTEEYLDLIISIRVVENIDEAIEHINFYGSHHSDAIVSENKNSQIRFSKEIDSAAVYINASTRFTDGAMFGLGAEMGISTDKLHARGPMGLNELTTYKWVAKGNGQIRS